MGMRVVVILTALVASSIVGPNVAACQTLERIPAEPPAQQPRQKPGPRATPPQAPESHERWRLSVNGGAQVGSSDFSQAGTFEEYQEEGTFSAGYALETVPLIDASLAYRLRGNFGVGVAVSFFDGDTSVDVQGQIPHPFFFNQPRAVAGSQTLKRRETGVHALLLYLLPVSDRVDLMLSGGPTALIVEQGVVDDLNYTHEFPYDTATFESVVVREGRKTAPGFNAGADLTWKVNDRLGVGVLVRYSRATATLRASDRNSVSIDAGALAVGGGVRVMF